jgi:hypothetical protein
MRKRIIRIVGTAIVIIIGICAIYLGGMHGYYEIMNGPKNPGSFFFDAISGNSLAHDFPGWPGWPAMSIIPNLLITGMFVIMIDGIFLFWLLFFLNHKKWGIVVFSLSILLCLFGGGFKPPFFGIVAGVIGIMVERTKQNAKP